MGIEGQEKYGVEDMDEKDLAKHKEWLENKLEPLLIEFAGKFDVERGKVRNVEVYPAKTLEIISNKLSDILYLARNPEKELPKKD